MFFNSWQYFIFLPIILIAYHLFDKSKQNILLVIASYFFYAAWDYRFCGLLALSTFVAYICGNRIYRSTNRKTRLTFIWISVGYNIFVLGLFKYLGFGIENFERLVNFFGFAVDPIHLNIILPIGISFYSFHAISYVVDIYRKSYIPDQGFIDVALFISFFPLLVAGPIERANHLLPQIGTKRIITPFGLKSGIFLILWGLFKKVVIADNLSIIVNQNFNNVSALDFTSGYLTLIAFAIQIFCDFSGYTDIARGTSRLLGFELLNNFDLPYFAVNPSDFWKRWHISLSSWLKDYLYIGLGGNRKGNIKTYRNLMITMILGGLWHGAAWNYVIWGAYQGLILVLHRICANRISIKFSKIFSIFVMFQFTLLGWLFFRCTATKVVNGITIDTSLNQIGLFFKALGRFNGTINSSQVLMIGWCVIPLLIYQYFQYCTKNEVFVIKLPLFVRGFLYALIMFTLVRFGVQTGDAFIYFQF